MEILQKFKQNGYFAADLYHLLTKKKLHDPSIDILPSEYEKQMKMTTQQRLQNLNNFEIDNIVCIGNKPIKVVLSFTPRLLVFQNYKPNEKIIAKFSVKNVSKAPTFLNMVFKESSYFSIKPCGGQLLSRLAPGISISFAVTFSPVQYEDYTHRVLFYTDVDQYNLPLIAMGPRPIFDFPDKVEIPKTPLKIENHVSIMVRNVGAVAAGCTLLTRCPFSVEPKSIKLTPGEHFYMKVKCKTMNLGQVQGSLYAIFETEENLKIDLLGTTHLVSVELEKQVVRFFDTYNTMVRQQVFKIVNKSDHILTYMCMKHECVFYDFQNKLQLAKVFYKVKESESKKNEKLVHYDVLSSDEHERVYTRIFFDEMQSLIADESLLFQNMHFSITPAKGNLWPNKATELTITFAPKEIGEFQTIAYLDIDGVFDRVPLTLVGISIPPFIQLNIETLDMDCVYINKPYNYEVVAINKGVPATLEVDVINESVVSIVGSVKISSDGPEISSITLQDYAVAESPKPKVPQWPREFNVEPCKVDIEPQSRITIKVTLIANLIRANQTSLELELEKSDSPPIILPVIYNALVPEITIAPDIKMRACFLDFAYKADVVVTSNEFRGYFTLEEEEEEGCLVVNTPIREGYIEPNSTICLPVSIQTSVLGMQEYSMRLNLFGLSKPIEICHISGCGVRPIVTCTPMALHWGQVKLLTTAQKCLTLCNDSPVVVPYKASLLYKDGRWQITPSEGVIEPESETDLILTLYLIDANTYTNKAVIQLEKVKDILVPLSATGVGTSILVGDLRDRVELGRHFTKIPLNFKVIMENRGTRIHALEWSEHYKAPKTKQPTSGFFNLEPRVFKMAAGEQLDLMITGTSNKVTTVKEMWYLVGSVEGINKKELLLACQVVAEFVDPKVEVSSTLMDFRYDYGPYSEHYKLTDIVTIKNVSKLPLDLDISTKPPFAIIQRHDTYIVPPEEENMCCCIRYRESDIDLEKLLLSLGPHQSRVFIDYFTSKPVEPQRRGSLNFFRDINKMKLAFNLTHTVEQRLEDRDVMKLQILFDTTKHASLKSKVEYPNKGHTSDTEYKSLTTDDTTTSGLHEIHLREPNEDCGIRKEICRIQNFSYIQTTTSPQEFHPELNQSPVEFAVPSLEYIKRRTMIKVTPMINTDCDTKFEWMHKFSKKVKVSRTDINGVLYLVPHRGLLKPGEIQYVNVMFQPKPNINVRATLECEVLGGPPETVLVTGRSSDLRYKINTHNLNFKIRSFHENAIEELLITNIAQLPFEYKTYLAPVICKNELEGYILELLPPNKVLEPDEEAAVQVVVQPGILGHFQRVFLLEIGHLPHIPIKVYGWGVIPQVYITLPRQEEIPPLKPEIGYQAIQTLTSSYLEADGYPSIIDVELAIERLLVVNHVKERPELLTVYATTNKSGPIQGFHTVPYIIDYGVVITGSTVQCIAEIVNYGPIATKLHFSKGTQIPNWLSMKLCGKLNPGETGKLEVTFSPTSFDFTELEQNVETSLHLEVPYGVSIPIHLKALCAVPYLMSNVKSIDFGSVRCGDKIVCSIPLKNVGKPTCIWYVTLRLKAHGPSPMVVMDSSGKYEPGEGGWLSVAFKPTMEMVYEGLLIFRFHMNPNRMTIPVTGQGIVPNVHVIGPNVVFPPTLPWAETTYYYFGLTNPCPFPIELIIAHSDEKWKEEEDIYNLLYKYYNKPEEMLVPAMKPGTGYPPEVVNFYQNFYARVKKLKEEEELLSAKSTTAKSHAASGKKAKTPNSKGGAKTPIAGKESNIPPVKFRTEGEIIADEMKILRDGRIDPLRECLKIFDEEKLDSDIDLHSKGFLLFVHGSPCEEMQCQEIAYSAGKTLNLPVINVDNCIVEALLTEPTTGTKELILATINEGYESSKRSIKGDSSFNGEEAEDDLNIMEDAFESLMRKILRMANNKYVGTPRSKGSDKKKKKSAISLPTHQVVTALGSTTLFRMDLTEELLIEYFQLPKFDRGFVVESLSSNILKNPPLVLTTILKCKSSIWNAHLILCQSDFAKWAQAYEESLKELDHLSEAAPKTYDDDEIKEIVDSFENMDEEEYEKAPAELKTIYITYGLEQRRKKYLEKIAVQSGVGLLSQAVGSKEKGGKDQRSKSSLTVDASDAKKKLKKDEGGKAKATTEYVAMNAKYNEYFKNTYENLINIANNWVFEECDVGFPLYNINGQVAGVAVKKLKKKSETQIPTSEVSLADRGFPLTLIMCPCINYKNAILSMLKYSPVVYNALKEEERVDVLKYPVKRKEYTVLLPKTFPAINHEIPLNWRYLDEVPVTSSQTSTTEFPSTVEKMVGEDEPTEIYPLPLHSVKSMQETQTRLVLEPGDLVRCKYSFNPQNEGSYSVRRFVEVSGWPDSRVDINISGICDLPRLDSRPKKMFENFVRRTIEDYVYKITYLDDLKLFEFGPIFVGLNRIYQEEYTIDLKNSSLITADIVIEFLEDTTVFQIDKEFIRLEPGCRDKLTISAAPADVDVHKCTLLFCVKDNPEIVEVHIACTGVKPTVEVLPSTKTIDYKKLLLYRREDDRFIVKNDSILPVMWKIRNPADFAEDFIISHKSGIVARHDNQVVPVTYIACRVGVISNRILAIDIYDAEGRGEPMLTDCLYLSAECYDVMVECAHENPTENYLNYGNVKVNSTVYRDMFLLNRGKYNIYFKFTLFPLGELNFHIIAVGTAIQRDVILNNTSKCPVTYEIILPEQYRPDPNAPLPLAKTKDNRIKNPPLKCGNFMIMNEDNLLAPGTSRTIQIQFFATASRKFEETINFIISDTCPAEAQGVPLRLVGTGAMPSLDFWNIETTFREHLIVKDLYEYKVPESSPHCVFVENSVTLHFFCVTVKTRFVGKLDLYNNGLVACALTMKLHYQSNSNSEIFSLDKYEAHIEPLMHKNLGIIFTPKALTEYRAVLEIKLKLLCNEEQSFKVCLIGQGAIPRIQMVSPRLTTQKTASLVLPVTCLGSVSQKPIIFKNISSVKSLVVADVKQATFEKRTIFWLTTDQDSKHMVVANNKGPSAISFSSDDDLNVSLKILLKPDEIATLNINYNPIHKGIETCNVKLTIIENPYEYFEVTCEAEAFMEDVILMGLEMLPLETDLEAYKTDTFVLLSGCELGFLQRSSVVMVNNSEKVYKFTWNLIEHLVVKPSMGYISPGEEKDIEILFYSAQPVEINKVRNFTFALKNVGKVPLRVTWNFVIDDEYPARIDKFKFNKLEDQGMEECAVRASLTESYNSIEDQFNIQNENASSKVTLFSASADRQSVDTWFEVDLPFSIEPTKDCLKPGEKTNFKVTFAPLDAFDFKVRLRSTIDNLDPYDQNVSCKLEARSLIPYVHLDIEESDYLTSGRRKVTGIALPPHITVLEFNVLGSGCYKKRFNVINPTSEAYEFIFEMIMSDKPELIPVHCDTLKGNVEGGTSTEVTFTFSPTAPGVYESQWKFIINAHNLVMNILVVGLVRESDVVFVPTILIIRNSLVGFTTTNDIILKNNESEALNFEFKGNSLCNESGKTPVIVEPNQGILKPNSETPIKIIYTPIHDGPQSFKIFCSIAFLTKFLTLCVNALSFSIKPKVTYNLIGNEHVLNSDYNTNIHLDQTASTYERQIPFTIRNNGSATFFFDWHYNPSNVKKYLNVYVEPNIGHVVPGNEVECILHFTLKQIPVQAFPVSLLISDGPEYNIFLYAEIEKPIYRFSCMDINFGKCFINTPDTTYKKNISFTNGDKVPVLLDLNFTSLPELYVDYVQVPKIEPGKRQKISIYFRPKHVKEYEFKLQFWVNSLCEEIVTIKGEGIPLLFDLYEGCQKSFDLGHVKVGEKIIRTIDVMNHSKMPIDATYIFREMYPVVGESSQSEMTSVCLSPSRVTVKGSIGPTRVQMLQNYKDDKVREQISKDIENALSSLKVVPNKCTIKPYRKVPLKIQFKPVGLISTLNVQLNMKVFEFERPLVRLSGCATGMSLRFSQNSLQFGRVRKRGVKILKVMLQNEGNFGARFWWQPLKTTEFSISPQQGTIAAQTNVTFTITFRPLYHNPFVKVWACCNIENYTPLELALYATCVDIGNVQNKTMYLECPVREVKTDYVVVTNPTDDLWLVLSEVSGGPFDTLKEFHIEPNSTFDIPVNFRPKSIGQHESQLLFSPLGESALFLSVTGIAQHPNPNGTIQISVPAKDLHTIELLVHNITEEPESYIVLTELSKVVPEKFEGYYEIKHPETIKTWGEASATCRWTYVCYEECEMTFKVMFINEISREYQFYNIIATVTASPIVATLTFVSRARESVQKELSIKNPLSTESLFYIKSEQLQCPDVLTINRKSEAILTMIYSPLVVGETEELLEVSNHLVGTYVYRVILKCLPAKEKTLEFSTLFGTIIPIRLKVQNRADCRADFICTVSHGSIQADIEYSLAPLDKGKFLLWFEPIELGVQTCRVSFDSPVAGEFIFNINGKGKRPKPQGPFEVKAGGFVTIPFKNVFEDIRTFKIYVDKPEFSVKMPFEIIKPKKDVKINVFLMEIEEVNAEMPTGNLTIETYEPASPAVSWIFFLQGIL
ncbi:unnamed protein product [Arctia plantaginis]|uniref:HYDIN/VesB/CFA65-like Ig-like domain-containing protein n=1 Tax=Arctia plantaginis TaxID=874455 RepID=A0A8S0ZBW8_ARCPL|nr:unnamed protein product [Arctia plantaginis]